MSSEENRRKYVYDIKNGRCDIYRDIYTINASTDPLYIVSEKISKCSSILVLPNRHGFVQKLSA